MPDIGNEEITGFNHLFIGFRDSESGMDGRIKGIKGFIEAIRLSRVHAGMIGLDMDEADMRIGSFGFSKCAQGEAVKCAVVAYEEFGYAVFGDMALNGGEKVWVYVGGGIGMTEEEAGFC